MGKFRHIEQIIGNPAHNLPYLRIIIIGIGKLLQMGISIPSHIRLDLRPHDMPHIRHIVAGQGIYNAQPQVKQPQAAYRAHGKGGQPIKPLIGNIAHNKGQHQLAYRSQRRTKQIGKQRFPVWFEIRNKSL